MTHRPVPRLFASLVIGCLALAGAASISVATSDSSLADEPSPAASISVPSAEPPGAAPADFPLRPGDQGALIKVLQKRLSWLGYSIAPRETRSATYGASTQRALSVLQKKFWLPADRYVTKKTWDRIRVLAGPIGQLPKACTLEDSICVSTEQKLVRWVVGGRVRMTADARFGIEGQSTARGTFAVTRKSRDHVSTLYRTAMPFSLFFHGGQAVHYSSYFKRDGYYGASHGCVNMRDLAKAKMLFNSARVGTRVHVY